MQEIWKSIPHYEGIYEASNFGRIRTVENKTTYTELHGVRHWKQRILKPKTYKSRDYRVSLWKDGKEKTWLVHRLVALTFIPNPENKRTINHIDGNPKNNNIENLEWNTYKENENHAFDHGLVSSAKNIILFNISTQKTYYFRSYAKASLFLGKNSGYISNILCKGKTIVCGYKVYLPIKVKNRYGDSVRVIRYSLEGEKS